MKEVNKVNGWLIPFLMIASSVITGCKTTEPPAYDKDKAPENRTEYNGWEGATQSVKDKLYVENKEQRKRCEAAMINRALAEKENNETEVKRQEKIISLNCP